MPKKITTEQLAKMMKKGFDETSRLLNFTTEVVNNTGKKTDATLGLLKLTRQEMAKDSDLKEVKSTVNSLYKTKC